MEQGFWEELQTMLFEGTFHEGLKRFRSPFVFRGMSNINYQLKTSLQRLEMDKNEKMENNLLRSFKKYTPMEAGKIENPWELLAMGQHHGLPTRLLDWSSSPFVALHFATLEMEKYNTDGVVWAINVEKANELLPDSLREILKEESAFVFTADMLNQERAFPTIGDLENEEETFLFFMEPPSIDDRIINQYAQFSVMSKREASLGEFLKQHPDIYKKICIPKKHKWEIRCKLDQLNINERVIYPGLDGICSWLKRYYGPNPPVKLKESTKKAQEMIVVLLQKKFGNDIEDLKKDIAEIRDEKHLDQIFESLIQVSEREDAKSVIEDVLCDVEK